MKPFILLLAILVAFLLVAAINAAIFKGLAFLAGVSLGWGAAFALAILFTMITNIIRSRR